MAGRYDSSPFDEEEVNPFAYQSRRGRGSGQSYGGGAFYMTLKVTFQMYLRKEKELQAKEAELKKREQDLKRKEDAIAQAGIVIEEKNWPPFFPIIHHDIVNEIPIHLQKLQYVALTTYLGLIVCLLWNFIAVTIAWINGEGWLRTLLYRLFKLF